MKSMLAALPQPLLNWYREHARDLPWRRTRDPYSVWVSEIMLQQTRVAAVLGYYARFLEAFPSVEALAQAPEERELLEQVLSLPAKYRLPLYLYYYEGYSVEEVGRLIGRKASTVQTQLARGREKLRALLREEGYHG